jgi:hypothetical protein
MIEALRVQQDASPRGRRATVEFGRRIAHLAAMSADLIREIAVPVGGAISGFGDWLGWCLLQIFRRIPRRHPESIDSSDGFRTMASSDGFRTMETGVCGALSVLTCSTLSVTGFLFFLPVRFG